MNKYIYTLYILAATLCLTFGVKAQEFDLLLVENFDATTIPTGWVSSVEDPPGPDGLSDGWEFGVTGYTGAWVVPASLDNSGFAISNDDPVDQDRSNDFVGVGFFNMTNYDSLTVLFDRFFNAQYGSSGFFYIDNGVEAVIFPITANAAWVEDGLTIANGQVLISDPFVFTADMVIGFLHNDNGGWGDGLAVDNVTLAGWLPPCETTGLTQVPASAVTAVGGSTTTISTVQNTGGEYSVVTGIQGSTEYDIAHSGDAYVTVRTGSASGPILAAGFAGPTPLTITTLSSDDLYLIWSDDQFCSSGGGTGIYTSTITGGAQVCAAESGALFAASGANACLGDELTAGEAIAPSVPSGYSVAYVVTDGAGNVVAGPFATPTYTPQAEGTFVIHTIVFDPADQGTILATAPSGAQAVANLFEENGGSLCGSLDLTGATFVVVDCPDNDVCADAIPLACGDVVTGDNTNASEQITGIPGVWYSFQGNGQDVTFSTCNTGTNPENLNDTRLWLITGGCSNPEIITDDDDGCGSIGGPSELTWYAHPDTVYYLYVGPWSSTATDLEGEFELAVTCACPSPLSAGTLEDESGLVLCLDGNGEAELIATELTAPEVPSGYTVTYVLTSGGTDYIIEAVNPSAPEFTVTEGGEYTIHTLVSTSTLDLSVVVFGTTSAGDVLAIVTGDDNICADLDVTGTGTITVNAPEVGTTVADAAPVCLDNGSADIGAESDGNEVVPAGYAVAYVLTDADNNLEILDANATGDFTVNASGNYVIHTFVYDPNEVPSFAPFIGQSATVVVGLISDGTVCAALDVAGAPITVTEAPTATISGDLVSCNGAAVEAQIDFTGTAPWDFSLVLPSGQTVPFTGISDNPYTLVLNNPSDGSYTLTGVSDADGNCPGVASGVATVSSENPDAGALDADEDPVCYASPFVNISATPDGNAVVPTGYSTVYLLVDANGDVVNSGATASFAVTALGDYTIHTLVYDPNTLTPGDYSTAADLIAAITPAGSICASLDATGASFSVVDCTPPANDLCADAETIGCGDVVSGDFSFASADLPTNDCGNTYGQGVWYVFAGTGDLVTVETCGSTTDTEITVLEGDCNTQTCVGFSDDGCGLQSTVTFSSQVGTDYFVYVSWWSSSSTPSSGDFDLTVTCEQPIANDDVCGALALSMGANGPFSTVGASAQTGEPVPPAGSGGGFEVGCESTDGWCSGNLVIENSVWFTFVAPASGSVTINTDNSYDTQIAVYEAAACGDLLTGGETFIGANDDNAGTPTVSFSSELPLCGLTPGNTYYLQVDGYGGSSGDLNILLTEGVVADFSSSATNLDVDFTDASVSNASWVGGGTIVSWEWDFDDAGATSTDQNPSHTFTAEGTYTVCLTVTDDLGCTVEYCEDVTVTDVISSITEALDNGMSIYPNPSNGEFVLEINGVEARAQLIVTDLTGRVVFTEAVVLNGNFRKELDLNVVSGTYLLQILTEEGMATRKLQMR